MCCFLGVFIVWNLISAHECRYCQLSDLLWLSQGFRECWPVGTIGATTWGTYETTIPVSILINGSQTGIKR
jgi:hypothetical protein